MKEVICYKLDNGRLYENKEQAIEAENKLNNTELLDHRQKDLLNFKESDIVYIASRDKVRQCKVISIEELKDYYDVDTYELFTTITIQDLNDKDEILFSYSTTEYTRDLNTLIKLSPLELFNFKYEEHL